MVITYFTIGCCNEYSLKRGKNVWVWSPKENRGRDKYENSKIWRFYYFFWFGVPNGILISCLFTFLSCFNQSYFLPFSFSASRIALPAHSCKLLLFMWFIFDPASHMIFSSTKLNNSVESDKRQDSVSNESSQ